MPLGVLSTIKTSVLIFCVVVITGCVTQVADDIVSAAKKGRPKTIEALLFNGTDINTRDESGVTALIAATERGDFRLAYYLVERNADVNIKARNGLTATYLAAYHGYEDILSLLLKNGVDVEATNPEGYTPLIIAAERGRPEIVKSLLRAGFDVNSKTNSGRTPLMFAALRGHVESVKILLKFQADVSLRAQYGETALDHALSGYHFAKRKNRWELLTPGMPFAEVQEIIGIVPEPKGLYTVKRTVVETDSGKYVFQYGKLVEWLINKFTNAVVSEERQLQAFEEIIELLQKTEEAFHSE